MPKIDWEIMDPNDVEYGPPIPWRCLEGWGSHTWQLSIEEGRITLTTDCLICQRAVSQEESELFEMHISVPVRLETFVEDQGDNSYHYHLLEPK